jgi:hypothetical protein
MSAPEQKPSRFVKAAMPTEQPRAIAPPRMPPYVKQCIDLHGSKSESDDKCRATLEINGHVNANLYDVFTLGDPSFHHAFENLPVSGNDSFKAHLHVDNAHECLKMYQCLREGERRR